MTVILEEEWAEEADDFSRGTEPGNGEGGLAAAELGADSLLLCRDLGGGDDSGVHCGIPLNTHGFRCVVDSNPPPCELLQPGFSLL